MSASDKTLPSNSNPTGTTAEGAPQTPTVPLMTQVREFVVSLGLLLLAVFFIRSSLFTVYVIPTGSMLPTIKIDDRVLANKLAYGLMLPPPFGERQIISWGQPKRGDIVLFQSPVEDHTFVKRVVGIAGDKVSFQNGVLVVNGKLASEVVQTDREILGDMGDSDKGADQTLYTESNVGDVSHYVLRSNVGGQTFLETREFNVPPGKVFCLGDNRDGSNDSRFWGFVDVDKIYGRATNVFYSTMRHDGWVPQFRTDRFLKPLN